MHEDIEKLLVLQERDRSITHAEQEIAGLEHERMEVNSRSADAETAHEAAQQKAKELEARKNGLVAFSKSIRVGTVGRPFSRKASNADRRSASALLSGSIVTANLALASVYSWLQ